MFAVIYQAYVDEESELEFQQAWHKIADYFTQCRGAAGSCLHKTETGVWLAYSRWPDKATRDASWPGESAPAQELPEDIKAAIIKLKNCMDQDAKIPDIEMEVVDDLLPGNKGN